jgi:tRNA wybutosine-synthesizing protein 1
MDLLEVLPVGRCAYICNMESLADQTTELLLIWHTHRIPILLSVVSLVALVRLTAYLRSRRAKISVSPPPSSPIEKKAVELKPEWLPEHTTLVPTGLNLDNHAEDGVAPVIPVIKSKRAPKTVKGRKVAKKAQQMVPSFNHQTDRIRPLVFFESLSGTTERFAAQCAKVLTEWTAGCEQAVSFLAPQVHDLSYIEYDDFFINPPKDEPNVKHFYLVIVPSYNIDTVLDNFLENLQETHNDFRIDTAPLRGLLGYSVFGFGDKEGWPTEEEGFCTQARQVDRWMAKLTGRKRAYPLGMGDVKSDAENRLDEWRMGVQEALVELAAGRGLGEGVPGSGDPAESDEEDVDVADNSDSDTSNQQANGSKKSARVDDVEDLGSMVDPSSTPIPIDFTTYKSTPTVKAAPAPKEMVPVTSPTHAALTKQGYSIIGSHSGVKICRWTKSALRGRGSCYKYSFYGIQSHLCMEATPSLSCSNKCVFCWRHGTNPVGTTWRWITDPPDMIFDGITAAHYKKIKMMKGVPGVRAERRGHAHTALCAFSRRRAHLLPPHQRVAHQNAQPTHLHISRLQRAASRATRLPRTSYPTLRLHRRLEQGLPAQDRSSTAPRLLGALLRVPRHTTKPPL